MRPSFSSDVLDAFHARVDGPAVTNPPPVIYFAPCPDEGDYFYARFNAAYARFEASQTKA